MASVACALVDGIDIAAVIPQAAIASPGQNVDLVRSVQRGDAAGMAELYEYISTGLRPYLARQLRAQDFYDKVHSIFVDVVIAIQRGQLREPHRLMGFARTIARRKVSGYIDDAATARRHQVDIGSAFWLSSPHATPEAEMISREQRELVRRTLSHLTKREGEILSRFYMKEQSQQQICLEMGLTHTQYRLLKWRSKARFEQMSRRRLRVPY
ncbi:MAG: sigma-70 family RNA polymerase sigma factor [Acidobacteriota bacterium]|nr:sigma-70 family RNA polymerase sigma factor [Acidobacteriota bacterium]